MEHDGIIPNERLSPLNVPSGDAELPVLEEFCLTVDGYQGERFSIEELLELARRIERAGLRSASFDELRTAAFIRQRELRWTTHGDEVADAPIVHSIRLLVAEIRRRVLEREKNDS